MALESECGVHKKAKADDERSGLPGVIKGLFAGRLVNYIEVRAGWHEAADKEEKSVKLLTTVAEIRGVCL